MEIRINTEDVKRALNNFAKKIRYRIVRQALKAAAECIVLEAKANAPVRTGLVRKRIGIVWRPPKPGLVRLSIYPRGTKKARATKDRRKAPFYYRFQEAGYHAVGGRRIKARSGDGRDPARRRREILSRGIRFIPGKAFLGRALATKAREALDIFERVLKRGIDEASRGK